MNFYAEQTKAIYQSGEDAIAQMQQQWQTETTSALGTELPKYQENIGKFFNALGDAALVSQFKNLMNLTGVGDALPFVKALAAAGAALGEGKHVAGGGPSPLGQTGNGRAAAPSAAQAMYPNLPSASPRAG